MSFVSSATNSVFVKKSSEKKISIMPTALQMQAMELEVESFRNAPLSDTRLTHYVTWQFFQHSQWTDLDQCVSARLESGTYILFFM